MERAQAAGIAVVPWTVNQEADLGRMIDWGVDGVITDYPDRAMALLGWTAQPVLSERERTLGTS